MNAPGDKDEEEVRPLVQARGALWMGLKGQRQGLPSILNSIPSIEERQSEARTGSVDLSILKLAAWR